MEVEIDDTVANRAYVTAINTRLADELRYISSQVWLTRLIGLGSFFILVGIVFYIGCLGYKNIRKVDDEKIVSKSVKDALDGFVLKATTDGSLAIENPTVMLLPNQTVAISDASTVRIAEGETVTVNGNVSVAIPLQNQNSNVLATSGSASQKAVQTNAPYFTVFKSMPYKSGLIFTGWKFLTTEQKAPTSQYCYYSETDQYSDTTASFEFAQEGSLKDKLSPPSNINIADAFDLCIWFSKSSDQ